MRTIFRLIAVFLLIHSVAFTQDAVSKPVKGNPALPKIEARAAEIVKTLDASPRGLGAPVADRKVWEDAAGRKAFRSSVPQAEKALNVPLVEIPESLYKEFYRNGNRTNYQNARGRRYADLSRLVRAECLENKGRFLDAIVLRIDALCSDPSWVLPAHDRNGDIYDGKIMYVDLVSSATAFDLAIIDYWLGEKLPAATREKLRAEVERRVFEPYERSLHAEKPLTGMWWMWTTNNWNAVCHANVVGAAALLIESQERRALYIAAAEHYMDYFFRGFTPDGYCSEGIGYWNYGFGHFVDLAEIVYQQTDGAVDFLKRPEVHNTALFAPRMEIAPGIFAAFADCSISAKPSRQLVGFLSRRLQFGLTAYEKETVYPENASAGGLRDTAIYCFPNSASAVPPVETLADDATLGIRTEFPDAGIFICRPFGGMKPENPGDLYAVFKGGHNGEHHNHNDVGSFFVVRNGASPLLDPGGEVYTQRTFSNKRYDSNLLNSFGHPVPRINGKLQKTGAAAKGVLLERNCTDDQDTYRFDITSAYGQKEIKEVIRFFRYNRKSNGNIGIMDLFKFTEPGTFETALITYDAFQNTTGETEADKFEFVIGDVEKNQAVHVAVTSVVVDRTLVFEAEEIKEDASSKKNPTRLSFRFKEPRRDGGIGISIRPFSAKEPARSE